jgi:hypothetical protein
VAIRSDESRCRKRIKECGLVLPMENAKIIHRTRERHGGRHIRGSLSSLGNIGQQGLVASPS